MTEWLQRGNTSRCRRGHSAPAKASARHESMVGAPNFGRRQAVLTTPHNCP
ncbi:MAG: hypothetical protein ACI85K_002349, partial [Hyphomicrobiaceae bacterium]